MSQNYDNFPIQPMLNLRGMIVNFTELSDDCETITIHLKQDR
jgi:hypothetical protein